MCGPVYGPERPSDHGADRPPHVPPRRPRPSDAASDDIAERIARAMALAPPDDQSTWNLSRAGQLPPEAEVRVWRARQASCRGPHRTRPVSRPGGASGTRPAPGPGRRAACDPRGGCALEVRREECGRLRDRLALEPAKRAARVTAARAALTSGPEAAANRRAAWAAPLGECVTARGRTP
jgi:hypothetical protein